MPRLSVVIITHNRETELRRCLRSVLSQTRLPDEVIVVDNASTDDTLEMLDHHFEGIRVIKSEINLGIPAGRNLGYREAAGDICVTIDDDAVFEHKDALAKAEQYFIINDRLCCVSFVVKDSGRGHIVKNFIPRRDRKILSEDAMGAFFVGTGHAMHRQRFIELGGFWEDLGMYFGEEPDLSYRILEAGYQILHSTSIAVLHYESRTARPRGRRIYHGTRNTPWIALKNLPWYSCITLTVFAWGYYFTQAIRYNQILSYCRGIYDCMKGMPNVLRQRQCISAHTITLVKRYSGVYWY